VGNFVSRPQQREVQTPVYGIRHAGRPAPVQPSLAVPPEPAFVDGERRGCSPRSSQPLPQDRIENVAGKVFVGNGLAVPTCRPEPQSALGVLLAEADRPYGELKPEAEKAERNRRSKGLVCALKQAVGGEFTEEQQKRVEALADQVVWLALDPVERLTLGVALLRVPNSKGDLLGGLVGRGAIRIDRSEFCAAAAAEAGAAGTSQGAVATVLLDALKLCVDAPCFRRIATAVIKDLQADAAGTGNSDVGHLRRYLQARALADTASNENDGFVTRVRDSSLDALRNSGKPPGTPPPDVQRDHFYWDCGFRSEASGSPLDEARKAFETFAQGIHAEPGGLLQPVAKHGLLGVTHHNWTEVIKDIDAALKPAGFGGSSSPHAGTLQALGAALSEHADSVVTQAVEALCTGLERLRGPRRGLLDVKPDIGSLLATLVRDVCMLEQVVRMKDSGANEAALSGKQALGGVLPREIRHTIRDRLISARVTGPEIDAILDKTIDGQNAVGLLEVMKLARKLASNGDVSVREALEACDPLSRAIEATGGRRPSGKQEIIDAICAFLSDAYFGNHLQLAVGRTLEPFARVVPNFVRIADLPASGSDCPPAPSLPLPAAPAPDGAPQTSDGDSWVPHVFSSLGVTLGGAFSSAQQMRLGAATHGAEIFLGNETSNRGAVRVAVPLAHHGTATIGGGFTGEVGGERRCKNSDGLIFRVERQHGPVGNNYENNDVQVRASAAHLAKAILESGSAEPDRGGNGKPPLDALIEALVQDNSPVDLNLLSVQQSKRSSISTSVGGGGGGGLRVTGDTQNCTRMGMFAGIAVGGKLTGSSGSQVEDHVSRFSVNSQRESSWGAQVDAKASATMIIQGSDRKVTVPIADLASAGAEGSDSGVVVKVRVPRKHGEIVSEKTFLDVETGSLAVFKGLVGHELEAWKKGRPAAADLHSRQGEELAIE
jgi:hypothetical protein